MVLAYCVFRKQTAVDGVKVGLAKPDTRLVEQLVTKSKSFNQARFDYKNAFMVVSNVC